MAHVTWRWRGSARRGLSLARWALLEPWKVWLAFGVPIAVFFASEAVPWGTADQRVRGAGLLMTLGGVVLVARGIADTRKMFGRLTYRQRLALWMKARPRILAVRGVTVNVSAVQSHSMVGTVTVSTGARDLSTVEGRLKGLEDDVRRIDQRIAKAEGERHTEIAKVRANASAEQESRITGDQELRKLIENVAAGGLDFEAIGVVWVIAGELFGSFSAELSSWLPGWL
jgi:hypothetical protein